jgi:hypothetical protein
LRKNLYSDRSWCVPRRQIPPRSFNPSDVILRKQELEKLISYSGTPTVVWRRTGEICLVGLEFSMLTEWSQQELQKKFIYEVSRRDRVGWLAAVSLQTCPVQLFERQSVVEYWEAFARHSFESHTQSVYSHCVLLKPSGEPVPCSFCFTIRRDIFDCPSLIIGKYDSSRPLTSLTGSFGVP